MANTEKMAVLKLVREAKSAVNKARARKTISPDDKLRLDDLYTILDDIEDELILKVLEKRVAQVEAACRKMEGVNKTLKKKVAELKRVAELVGKAADGIKLLVDIATKSAALVG